MGNRYNQYQKIDYISLPIDAYAQAAGSLEQENLMKLQETKSIYDGMQDVEASYNPDRQLKAELLDGVQKEIAAISNKNLKGNDALLQLNKIVNNRDTIDKLANVKLNTINYKAAVAAQKKYQDDYGNDINLQQGVDEIEAYNKLDSKGFKPGMMQGYTPGKFLDVVGDAQKLLKDSKGNSVSKVWHNNQWMYKKDNEFLTEEMLLEKAMPLFNDPKYATQLKNLQYYGLKKYGNNPQEALANYNTNYVTALNTQISEIAAKISEYDKLAKEKPKAGYQQLIEKGKAAIAQLSAERDMAKDDKSGDVFSRNLKLGLAKSALSPFTYSKETMTEAANPYGLASYKSNLAFGNWKKKHEIEKKEEMERNPVNPIIGTVDLKDGTGKSTTQAAAIISKDGGFNMENIGQTVGFLIQSVPKLLDENSNPVDLKIEDKKKLSSNVQAALKSGDATLSYLAGKKEYMVSMTDGKKYRMPADLNMQQEMEPLYRMYGTDPVWKDEQAISLDGKTLSKVIVTRQEGDKASHLFTPVSDFFNINKLSGDDVKKLTGMNINNPLIFQAAESMLPGEKIDESTFKPGGSTGVRILVEGQFPDKYDGKGTTSKVYTFSPKKYEDAKAMGFNETGNHVVYSTDNNKIQIVQGLDGGPANANIINSHMRYASQPGKRLNFLKSTDAQKTKKVEMSEVAEESESTSNIAPFN